MHTRRDRVLNGLLLAASASLVIAAGFLWLQRWTTPPGSDATKSLPAPLVVKPAELDVGEVWEDSRFEWTFRTHNRSPRNVVVDDLRASCACTEALPRRFVVPPGESQVITMTIDLMQKAWRGGRETVPLEVELEPRLGEGPIMPMTWRLQGTIRRNPIVLSRDTVDLDDRSVIPDPLQGDDVLIDVAEELVDVPLEVVCVPADVGLAVLQPVGPRQYRLTIGPVDSLGPGRFEYRVLISAPERTDAEGLTKPGPARTIIVTGTIASDLRAQPDQLTFGPRPPGAITEEMVLISSTAGRAIVVESIEIDGLGTLVERVEDHEFGEEAALMEVSGSCWRTSRSCERGRREKSVNLALGWLLAYIGSIVCADPECSL